MYELWVLSILHVCHFSLRIIVLYAPFYKGILCFSQYFHADKPIERNFLNNFSKIFPDFVWTATGDSFAQKNKFASGEE